MKEEYDFAGAKCGQYYRPGADSFRRFTWSPTWPPISGTVRAPLPREVGEGVAEGDGWGAESRTETMKDSW